MEWVWDDGYRVYGNNQHNGMVLSDEGAKSPQAAGEEVVLDDVIVKEKSNACSN